MNSILVLCPLKKELEAVIEALSELGLSFEKKQDQGRWYFINDQYNLYLSTGGHGKTQFGIGSQFWINKFKPNTFISMGAAGAIDSELNVLDVVIASQIIEHDYKEKFNPNEPLPTFDCLVPEFYFSETISFKIHTGILTSGDEDIVSNERASELYEKTKALAVAWESVGGVRAAQFNNLKYFEFRGLTDNARDNVASQFVENLKPAMKNCSLVLWNLLSNKIL